MRVPYNKKSITDHAFKEIQYILTSTNMKHAVNPANKDHIEAVNRICKSILYSTRKLGQDFSGTSVSEIVRNSVIYKIAEICKTAGNYKELVELAREFLPPSISPGIGKLMKYAGFMWEPANFEYKPKGRGGLVTSGKYSGKWAKRKEAIIKSTSVPVQASIAPMVTEIETLKQRVDYLTKEHDGVVKVIKKLIGAVYFEKFTPAPVAIDAILNQLIKED